MRRANRRRLRSDHIGKTRRPHLDERGRPWSNRLIRVRDRLFLRFGQLDLDEIEDRVAWETRERLCRTAEDRRVEVGVRCLQAEFAGLVGQESDLRLRYEVLIACIAELEELQLELEGRDSVNAGLIGDRIKDLQFERNDVEVNLMHIGVAA